MVWRVGYVTGCMSISSRRTVACQNIHVDHLHLLCRWQGFQRLAELVREELAETKQW